MVFLQLEALTRQLSMYNIYLFCVRRKHLYRSPGFDCTLQQLQKTPLSWIASQKITFCGHMSLKISLLCDYEFLENSICIQKNFSIKTRHTIIMYVINEKQYFFFTYIHTCY